MLKLFLWLRYLRKKKIVLLSIAAVALSVSLLIIVASLFNGFINALEQTAVQTIGDVVLLAPTKFAKYPLFIERLEQTNAVEAATATLSAQGLLHLGKGNVRAVHIWGIEPVRRAKVTGFKQFLRKQGQTEAQPSFTVPDSPQSIGGFVGIAVIAEPNEKTDEYDYGAIDQMFGQQVILTTGTVIEAKPDTSGQIARSAVTRRFKRKTLKFTIVDILETGVYDLDESFVYLPIEKLQEILYPDEERPACQPNSNQTQRQYTGRIGCGANSGPVAGVCCRPARLGRASYKIYGYRNGSTDAKQACCRAEKANGSFISDFWCCKFQRDCACFLHILYDCPSQTERYRNNEKLRGSK